MDLRELREQIDSIDHKIFELFRDRCDCAAEIGAYKQENGLPVLDRGRERAKVFEAASEVPEDLKTYAQVLMELLMEASRMRQSNELLERSQTAADIQAATENTSELFPTDAFVACQGIEGAYSQIACERIFKHPQISYFDAFEAVFKAVEQGFCDYGILPIENSTAGSVNRVFDLMMEHSFSIVRSTRIKVDHALLAKPCAKMSDIRTIYSHEQAISQCSEYLSTLNDVQIHRLENTAIAACTVAESDTNDVAALSNESCAELYGLQVMEHSVQDRDNNYTRFATISKQLEIYSGADRSSLMLILNHEPGSLYKVLAKFYALDINIIKLESRPLAGRDFEFMFFFDIECPVLSPEFKLLIATLPSLCQEFRYLGSYSEVV